jgi:hypothetical protein
MSGLNIQLGHIARHTPPNAGVHGGTVYWKPGDELVIAKAKEQDRPLALRLLTDLPGHRLRGIGLY